MSKRHKKRANEVRGPAKDELVDVLLILARYLDSKELQEMSLKMSDGRKVVVRIDEDIFARYRSSDDGET